MSLNKIKYLLLEKNKTSFKVNSDNAILKIRKTDFIMNVLHYLLSEKKINNLFFSKKKKRYVTIKTKKLLDTIIDEIPKSRGVHPYFFFLFHKELLEYGIEFKYFTDVNTIEIRSNTIKIREQIQESFKIVERILSDSALEHLSPSIYNSFLNNNGIKIEEKIKTGLNRVQHRFIDMSFQITESSKVYIEINEHHHNKELDLERAVEIYLKNNTQPIMVYKEEIDFEEIIKNIWKEIAYALFKENSKEAMIIYLNKVDKFDLSLAKFFVEIQSDLIEKNEDIPLEKIKKFMSFQEFKNFYEFVKKMIDSEDLNSNDHFTYYNSDNLKDSKLNKYGYDTLLMLPRKKDWYKSSELKKCFSDFKSNYLILIKELMSAQFDRIDILKQACLSYKTLSILSDSTFICLQKLIDHHKDIINQKLGIELHSKVWCFKYQKGERVPFYELEKIFNKNIIDYIKLHNETKQNILNYKLLNSYQLDQIIDLILNHNHLEESESNLESDEEELNL